MNTSSGKNPDPVPAGITDYQRRILIRDQARKARKSPDTSEMYSIHLPFFRVTFLSIFSTETETGCKTA
jgi:hypothetical protein